MSVAEAKPDPQMSVPERLLKPTNPLPDDLEQTHPLLKGNDYDKVGGNGVFTIDPPVVKFSGFEILKTHTLWVRLVNVSNHPQWLYILPPMTPYYKVNYKKKGMIPSGVSEDVYIQFTPDSYKYYYDCMRLHCEGEKLLVPIHGYPVINNDKDSLLPEVIDMGKIKVGEIYSKKLSIESNSPVMFEYSIEWIKSHPDIMIEPL